MILGFITALLLVNGCAPTLQKVSPQPEEKEPTIRVNIDDTFTRATLRFSTPYTLKLEEAVYLLDSTIGSVNIKVTSNELRMESSRRNFQLKLPLKIQFTPQSENGEFEWNGRTYSGVLELVINPKAQYAINVLPLESYLEGVVPWEIPTGNEEYRPAVMSQVVAARSYALHHLAHPRNPLFHIYSDVRDQVYRGLGRNSSLVKETISDTRGLVLFRNGEVLEALYHSTCGGILNSTDENGPRRDIIRNGIYNCEISPFFRWIEIRTPEDILKSLYRNKTLRYKEYRNFLKNGVDLQLVVEERNPSGYIQKLTIQVNGDDYTFRGFRIRKILADSLGNPLPSRLFFLIQNREALNRFYIIGAGYGHGKGLCQWGAIGMALQGFKFKRILQFYYPNTQLTKIY